MAYQQEDAARKLDPLQDPIGLQQPFDNRLHSYTYVPRNGGPGQTGATGQEAFAGAQAFPGPFTMPGAAMPMTMPHGYQYQYHPNNFGATNAAISGAYTQHANYLQYPQYYTSGVPYPGAYNHQPVGFQAGQVPGFQGQYPYNPYGYNHTWLGRTAVEIENDNRIIASRDGVHEPLEMMPREPRDDQMFWVREIDGTWTLRNWFTIENDLRPGRWQMDAQRGNLVFIRKAE